MCVFKLNIHYLTKLHFTSYVDKSWKCGLKLIFSHKCCERSWDLWEIDQASDFKDWLRICIRRLFSSQFEKSFTDCHTRKLCDCVLAGKPLPNCNGPVLDEPPQKTSLWPSISTTRKNGAVLWKIPATLVWSSSMGNSPPRNLLCSLTLFVLVKSLLFYEFSL